MRTFASERKESTKVKGFRITNMNCGKRQSGDPPKRKDYYVNGINVSRRSSNHDCTGSKHL
jgi:hypothetical protein